MHLSRPWSVFKGLLITLLLSESVYAIDLDISDERASNLHSIYNPLPSMRPPI